MEELMDKLLKIPNHVAFIMDGNGRWAKKRMLPRAMGHRAGTENLRNIITHARDLGIQYVTFYAFSTENWKRPIEEVNALMDILVTYLKKETQTFVKENARLCIIGDMSKFPDKLQKQVKNSIDMTSDNDSIIVTIALNYSGRSEIIHAMNKFLAQSESVVLTEELFEKHLDTKNMPDPDLLIRTSGELRLSNFMLWQLAYSEFYFTDVLWPDFDVDEFDKALETFTKRDRRYGGLNHD